MNGHLDNQTSGNDWTTPHRDMLHETTHYASLANMADGKRTVFNSLEAQMAEFEADHQATIAEVLRLYVISNDAVIVFLNEHRIIPQFLIEAVPLLKNYFGDTTVFSLRAVTDEHGWQTLYAVVVWPGKVGDVVSALGRFEDGWWIANSHMASGKLTFTYELV